MRIRELYHRAAGLFGPRSAEVDGTIEQLRVHQDGGRERWLLKLDTRDDVVFLFEPSAISRPRKKGDRVRIGYAPVPGPERRMRADWITAA
jgi:hypothetical protein